MKELSYKSILIVWILVILGLSNMNTKPDYRTTEQKRKESKPFITKEEGKQYLKDRMKGR